MSLESGSLLTVEDLGVTMKVVTFNDTVAHAIHKYKGRSSKRKFSNIMKMRWKKHYEIWKIK